MRTSKIMTVQGLITPEELGFTSMHEHIMFKGENVADQYECPVLPGSQVQPSDPVTLANTGLLKRNFTLSLDGLNLDDEEVMKQEVGDFKEAGGSGILEVTGIGKRWNLPAIRRISEQTGVHIVVATGFYQEDTWPAKFNGWSVESYRKHMLHEVHYGIDETGIYPGHVKVALHRFSKGEERTLRAAAQVAAETGLSLTVHPSLMLGGDAVQAVKILLQEGLMPERIVVAHVSSTFVERDLRKLVLQPECWTLRLDHARTLLNSGVNISLDFLGNNLDLENLGEINPNDWQKLAGLIALLKEGYAKQIVLGTDLCVKILARRYGGEGYCRLTNFVVPTLRDLLGVADYAITQMFVKNPARILAY